MRKGFRFGLFLFMFAALLAEAASPVVSNVRASQRSGTKLVDIWYNVSDSDGDRVNVLVGVKDGGSAVSSSSFTGYIGNNLSCGYNKKITWNAGEDWSGNLSTLTITVTADDSEMGICPVPKTGQTISYRAGDDGDLEKGVTWPNPRFTDHGDGTVTDNLTRLEWVKAPRSLSGISGRMSWGSAVDYCRNLNYRGHSDWRLPSRKELMSLIDCGRHDPPLPAEHPFLGLQDSWFHWSGTTRAFWATGYAWVVKTTSNGGVYAKEKRYNMADVWPVRGGS